MESQAALAVPVDTSETLDVHDHHEDSIDEFCEFRTMESEDLSKDVH